MSESGESGSWERFIDSLRDWVEKNPDKGEEILEALLEPIYNSGVVQKEPEKYPLLNALFRKVDNMSRKPTTPQQETPSSKLPTK